MNRVKVLSLTVALVAVTAGLAGCGGSSSDSSSDSSSTGSTSTPPSVGGKVDLVAYSTPEASYTKLIPAFNDTPEGKDVTFNQSYGASGDQSRAVDAGQHADVVHFALAPDIDRLVTTTSSHPTGIRTSTTASSPTPSVVFVVRKGNPKNIKTWDDLVKPGVQVITPNPFTSGGARWNIMAAYGAQLRKDRRRQAGTYLNSCSITSRCRTTRPATRCRRSSAARATCCSTTSTTPICGSRPESRSTIIYPALDHPDPEPDGRTTVARFGGRQGVRRLMLYAGRARRSGPDTATARYCPTWRPSTLPTPGVPSSRSTAWVAGTTS